MTKAGLNFLRRFPLAPLLCFGAGWLSMQTEVMKLFELRTLDWRTQWRAHFQSQPDARFGLVLFDDSTDEQISWPPDRKVHCDFTDLLGFSPPAVVVWDVILDASREGGGDDAFAKSVKAARARGTKTITASATTPEVVESNPGTAGPTRQLMDFEGDIARLTGDEHALVPFPQLRAESWHGLADTPPGLDGMRRAMPLVVRVGQQVFPSLALQVLMVYLDVPVGSVKVRLGDAVTLSAGNKTWRLPVADDGTFLLNYRYDQDAFGHYDFRTWSYLQLLLNLHDRYVEPKPFAPAPPDLRGGILFIGQIVKGKADMGPSPRQGLTPLVLIHANLVHSVLAQDYVRVAPAWLVWLGGLGLGFLSVAVGRHRPVAVLVAWATLAVVSYVALAFAGWVAWSLWLPLTGPLAAFVALQFIVGVRRVLQEQRGREAVNRMFGTYLSPELLKKMLQEKKGVVVRSERRPVTILFSDLRDFTKMSESMGQNELIALLNEYLAAMVECIHEERGTLHKFIGDAVMAVWGDLSSESIEMDAARAARAAQTMHRRLAELNAGWRAAGRAELRMGIGLNHGTVLVGNIGSPRRMEFTVIGDAVNLASRLESLTKELAVDTLVGEALEPLLAGGGFRLEPRGMVPVKGKARPVAVYALSSAAAQRVV